MGGLKSIIKKEDRDDDEEITLKLLSNSGENQASDRKWKKRALERATEHLKTECDWGRRPFYNIDTNEEKN